LRRRFSRRWRFELIAEQITMRAFKSRTISVIIDARL
jgi:hypothetical protein